MAHQFDTGLQRAQRTTIRNGAVTLLSGLLRSNGGYLQAVIPWGGLVRGYTDQVGIDMLMVALNGRAPGIAVGLGDRTIKPGGVGGFAFKASVQLVVYFYSSHARDITDGRMAIDVAALAADTADPGLELIMEQIEELLVGQYPGTNSTVKQVVPYLEEELRTEPNETLWAQHYSVVVDRVINPYRTLTQLLTDFRTKVRTSDPEMVSPNDPLLEMDKPIP